MYITIRSRTSSSMDLIRPELFQLSAIDLESLPYFDFVYTLASANKDQSAPNLANIYNDHKISDEFDYGSSRT